MTQSLQHNKSLVSLNQVFIFFFMVVATDIFAIIPMLGYFMIPIYMVFYPILLFFYAIYLLDNSLVKRKFIMLDLLILFLLIMPFYSAFMANRVFGQSLYVGVKNMMPFFTVVSASLTLYLSLIHI